MPIPSSPDEMATWRTYDQAATQLKLSKRTISRWVNEGHIRAYRRPGDRRHYVDLDEIKRYQDQYTPIERKSDES